MIWETKAMAVPFNSLISDGNTIVFWHKLYYMVNILHIYNYQVNGIYIVLKVT